MYTQIGRSAVSRRWGVPMCFAGEDGKKSWFDRRCFLPQIDLRQVAPPR